MSPAVLAQSESSFESRVRSGDALVKWSGPEDAKPPADRSESARLTRAAGPTPHTRRPLTPTSVIKARYEQFGDFYADHADPIYRALSITLGDPVLAADATSEAMTRACQRWSSVRDGSNPPGWVYRVGLNWTRSRWRKLRRERPLSHQLEEPHGELDPTATMVQAAVAKLPMNQRSVVVLRFYLQWTPSEISESLDLPVGTVKSRLHRGLAAMRVDLSPLRLDALDEPSANGNVERRLTGRDEEIDLVAEDAASPAHGADVAEKGEIEVDLRSRQRSIGRAPAGGDR